MILAIVILHLMCMVVMSLEQNVEQPVLFNLEDDTANGTELGNVYQQWRLTGSGANADPQPPRYTNVFLHPDTYFRMDLDTTLYAARDLDRDVLCLELGCCALEECILSLECHLIQGIQPQKILLRLRFRDSNDNAPVWEGVNRLEVPESTPIGSFVSNFPKATDRDSRKNGVQKHQLLNDTPAFSLQEDFESNTVRLRVEQMLDRESRSSYLLTVLAMDNVHTATLVLTVEISDLNDETPRFPVASDKLRIMENHNLEEVLYRFNATDGDIGPNGKVTYEISAQSRPATARNKFYIDPSSGLLMLSKAVDYEKNEDRFFELLVVAKDMGNPPLSSTMTLSVQVLDENDHAPTLVEKESQPLKENVGNNVIVKALSIEDKDEASRDKVSCFLADDAVSQSFILHNYSLTFLGLLNRRAFDYELATEVYPRVTCVDAALPRRTVEVTLKVRILDENDNAPFFPSLQETRWVPENTRVGSHLFTLSAFDKDSGLNSKLHYNMSSLGDTMWLRYLTINPDTGRVTLLQELDRENIPQMSFLVQATDCSTSSPPKSNFTNLILKVADCNDNVPIYLGREDGVFYISEDADVGTVVNWLQFADPDAGENGSLVIQVDPDSRLGHSLFRVVEFNKLVVQKRLDRESHSNVSLLVVARDSGVPPLKTMVSITCVLLDVNDNSPVLIRPLNGTIIGNALPIPRSAPRGTMVVTLRARDDDAGENGTVRFYLDSVNSSRALETLFSVDPVRGVLLTDWTASQEPPSALYALHLRLSDLGHPPRSSFFVLYVNVSDVRTASGYPAVMEFFGEITLTNWGIGMIVVASSVLLFFLLVLIAVCAHFGLCRGLVPGSPSSAARQPVLGKAQQEFSTPPSLATGPGFPNSTSNSFHLGAPPYEYSVLPCGTASEELLYSLSRHKGLLLPQTHGNMLPFVLCTPASSAEVEPRELLLTNSPVEAYHWDRSGLPVSGFWHGQQPTDHTKDHFVAARAYHAALSSGEHHSSSSSLPRGPDTSLQFTPMPVVPLYGPSQAQPPLLPPHRPSAGPTFSVAAGVAPGFGELSQHSDSGQGASVEDVRPRAPAPADTGLDENGTFLLSSFQPAGTYSCHYRQNSTLTDCKGNGGELS